MSLRKQQKKKVSVANPKLNSTPKSTKNNGLLKKMPVISTSILFGVLVWVFTGLFYSDVFYIARQYNFFLFDLASMNFVWSQPYGGLWLAGRALLEAFHYPLLGGALLALMLTLCSWFLGYVLNLPIRYRFVQYLPSVVYLFFLVYRGYNLYYYAEPGMIMGIPLCALVVLMLLALILRIFSRKTLPPLWCASKEEKIVPNMIANLIVVVAVCAVAVYSRCERSYVADTAKMQRQMWQQDWEGMIETAQKSNVSCRPIAAYYAIALMQTGKITTSLFDIPYHYEDIHIHLFEGKPDRSAGYYQNDCNFYAGLLFPAHHRTLEYTVQNGPSWYMLKRLALIALLNEEKQLARKYFHILKKSIIEQAFVTQYEPMIDNRQLVTAHTELNKVLNLTPVDHSFEQWYREPIFLGYNLALAGGRSMEALHASIASCLYTKSLPSFLGRAQIIMGQPLLEKNIEDALIFMSSNDEMLKKAIQPSAIKLAQYQSFLQAASPYFKDREQGFNALYSTYKGYFPFYYFFENIRTKDANKPKEENQKKGGVN